MLTVARLSSPPPLWRGGGRGECSRGVGGARAPPPRVWGGGGGGEGAAGVPPWADLNPSSRVASPLLHGECGFFFLLFARAAPPPPPPPRVAAPADIGGGE